MPLAERRAWDFAGGGCIENLEKRWECLVNAARWLVEVRRLSLPHEADEKQLRVLLWIVNGERLK